jgi:hypothetical protein
MSHHAEMSHHKEPRNESPTTLPMWAGTTTEPSSPSFWIANVFWVIVNGSSSAVIFAIEDINSSMPCISYLRACSHACIKQRHRAMIYSHMEQEHN